MYGEFQSTGRPDPEVRQRPQAEVKEKPYISIIVETIIRDRSTSAQPGIKSMHMFRYDGAYYKNGVGSLKRYRSVASTGTTDIPGLGKKEGIRNKFQIDEKSISDNKLDFWMKGETASAVGVLPNINYNLHFKLDLDNRTFSIGGNHDGYPSYVVNIAGTEIALQKIYDFEQGYLLELFGSGDVTVSESGSF